MGRKSSASQAGGEEKNRESQDKRSSNGTEADACKGLCVNCANRFDCLLPKAEGGVWHCEEYIEES